MADRLPALEALRDLLADRLAVDDGKQSAALAKQYRDTLREIDELKRAVKKGSLVDELADRRKSRGAGASGVVPASRGGSERGS